MTKTATQPGKPPVKSAFRNPVFRECRQSSLPVNALRSFSQEDWLSADEAAELIGCKRRLIYDLGYNGSILVFKFGVENWYYRADVEQVRDWYQKRREEEKERLKEQNSRTALSVPDESGKSGEPTPAEPPLFPGMPPSGRGVVQFEADANVVTARLDATNVTREEFESFKRDVVAAINLLADAQSGSAKKQMFLRGLFTVHFNEKE